MAVSRFARTYEDESSELSVMDFRIREMNASTIAALLTELAALGTAIDDLSSGTLRKSQAMQDSSTFGTPNPVDPNAQRERKWRVEFIDTVNGKSGKVEIPVAFVDANVKVPGSDLADMSDTKWIAFVTAFEATARTVDGNVLEVQRAVLVGRNL